MHMLIFFRIKSIKVKCTIFAYLKNVFLHEVSNFKSNAQNLFVHNCCFLYNLTSIILSKLHFFVHKVNNLQSNAQKSVLHHLKSII